MLPGGRRGHWSFRHRVKGLAIAAIENIVVAIFPALAQSWSAVAVFLQSEQHDWLGCIVIPNVVMDFLKTPAYLSVGKVESDDRRRMLIVASSEKSVCIGSCIRGRNVDEAKIGVDSRSLPDRGSAML